ncbi:MAG: RNA methyltransferase [Rickettsiales bacterium]|nr:RNA methyltransferase [Rickettsiales bacterium]
MEEVVIILVKPQLGENIGMAARAMFNFGINSLRLVQPRTWPNESAVSSATHAAHVVKQAKLFNSVREAVADLDFLYGTTARSRSLNKSIISSVDLKSDIQKLKIAKNKIGILFGPENSGLDNETIAALNKIVSIPVYADFFSINLAVAVGIICYELSKVKKIPVKLPAKNKELASQQDIMVLLDHLEVMLDKINFYQTTEKKKKMQQNINCLFKRIDGLTKREVSTLMGILQGLFRYQEKI